MLGKFGFHWKGVKYVGSERPSVPPGPLEPEPWTWVLLVGFAADVAGQVVGLVASTRADVWVLSGVDGMLVTLLISPSLERGFLHDLPI